MILRVGLTGGIGSGKSSVARLLAARGCAVIDSDQIVRDLYRPGQQGWEKVVETWGREILTPEGEIDRPRLSAAALATADGAAKLNSLIHPLVIAQQQKWLSQLESGGEPRIAVIEATLLLESGGRERCHRIVVVVAGEELQIRRAVLRGLPESEVRKRMARQLRDEEREALADYVIRNDRELAELEREVDQLMPKLERDLSMLSAK